MELRRLEYFVAVAEALSFRRAAEQLHVAQPGLSQQIKALERELDVKLMDRGPWGVRLTGPGELLLRDARRILEDVEAAIDRVRDAAAGRTGRLRLAHTRSAPELGHRLVASFREAHPRVSLDSTIAWTSRNVALLRAAKVDVGFVRLPLSRSDAAGLEVIPLTDEPVTVALPAAHELCGRRTVRHRDLAEQPIVFWPREQGPGAYDHIVGEIWGDATPRIALEEPDAEHLLAAVEAGTGLTLLGRSRAARLRQPGVVLRRLQPEVLVTHGIAWRAGDQDPVVAAFVAAARAAAGAQSRRGNGGLAHRAAIV